MLLLRTGRLPEGAEWECELKLDGYRALAFKTGGKIQLRSRNNNDFTLRYSAILNGLHRMPDETVIDGEVAAFDGSGRPSFNTLQNYGSSKVPIFYYALDVLILAGRDLQSETLDRRRELLRTKVPSKLHEPIRYSADLDGNLPDLIRSVRDRGLESLVAKRHGSAYEPGQRSGAWRKMRITRGQEFIIGGYTPSPKNFDALIFGYYEGEETGLEPAMASRLLRASNYSGVFAARLTGTEMARQSKGEMERE